MTAVPQADVEAHRTTSSKAGSHGGQSRWRRVTMVGHSSPEQSARHLPERLGETRWLFMEVLRVKQRQFELRPFRSPSRQAGAEARRPLPGRVIIYCNS